MSLKMPDAPPPPAAVTIAPPPPMFGQQSAGAARRVADQANKQKAFGGSLMGSQLTAASTGQKTLLGATG